MWCNFIVKNITAILWTFLSAEFPVKVHLSSARYTHSTCVKNKELMAARVS